MSVIGVNPWIFSCAANRTWTWRTFTHRSRPFPSIEVATEDAVKQGFDPSVQYWISTVDGRTTHYRPGKSPVTLPFGVTPED